MDFSSFQDVTYPATFRFPKALCVKIRNLLQRFYQFGVILRVSQGQAGRNFYTFKLEEIILIYLRRMVVPDRLSDVAREFGRSMDEILTASIFMSEQLNTISKEYLDRSPSWWDENQARYNAGLVNKFDIPLTDVCIFIDAMLQNVANPWIANIEARFYSGNCRQATNMFILAVCPQGLYIFVSEWSQGRRQDMMEAMGQNMYPRMRALTQFPHFKAKTFANSQFRNEDPVYTPYSPCNTAMKLIFNNKMASVSLTAEWAFQIVRNLWPSVKYIPRQRIQQGHHGNLTGNNLYNSFFLTNLYTCFSGTNLIAEYFGATTLPSIEEYLGVPENSLD